MKFLYNWLKKLFNTEKSQPEAGLLLAEEESKGQTARSFEKVVVGKILEINKHPNADRLQIAKLQTTNNQLQTIQVVCGASNIEVGQMVPVALVGAKLSGGEIKEVEIRGVKSLGMLCAKDELGLGTDHSGIMILDSPPHQCGDGDGPKKQNGYWCGGKKAEIGMEFSKYINK